MFLDEMSQLASYSCISWLSVTSHDKMLQQIQLRKNCLFFCLYSEIKVQLASQRTFLQASQLLGLDQMVSIKLVSKILKLKLQISKLSLFYLFIFLGKKEVLDLNASLLCSKTSQAENFFLISCFHKVLFYLLSQRIRFCRSCDHVKLYQSLQMSRKYHTPQQQNLKKLLHDPFFGMGLNCLRATQLLQRDNLIFATNPSRSSWYSFNQPWKDRG